MTDLTQADLDVLKQWDTPTICNGLEVVMPERRAIGFTVEYLHPANVTLPPIVGYARTATYRSYEPAAMPGPELRQKRIGYYEYVAAEPRPTVVIIQDLDPNPGYGAFWGEVNSNIHKGLGCLGCVTNGSFRDIDMLAPGFQILGGKIGPSHSHGHIVDFGGQVNIFGMTVKHNDIIHADRHGAVVIPAKAVRELPAAIDLVSRKEKVILDACKSPDFGIEMLRKAMADQADIH